MPLSPRTFRNRLPAFAAGFLCLLLSAASAAQAQALPENLGRGLLPIVREFHSRIQSGKSKSESFREAVATAAHAQADTKNRVLVDVLMDGKAPLDEVSGRCAKLGGAVTAASREYRKGLISAWLPLDQVEVLAKVPGVSAVHFGRRGAISAWEPSRRRGAWSTRRTS